jgi:hypothetical protein
MSDDYVKENYISVEPDLLTITEVREELKKQLSHLGEKSMRKCIQIADKESKDYEDGV